jgi:hypothetical protein
VNLQPEDFWSFSEWLLRPNAFLESALLQGIVLMILAIVVGLMVGYVISAARYGPVEGFYAVARTVRDFIRFDLPGTSPRRIFALARLAFKEAIRRKVLFVIGLFVVGLLLAGWYLDPTSDDPARLYISFVLTATNYLVLALALFISAFSLPSDIKSKTIYTIVTKPVRPTEIVLGRMLGFVGVGTLILIPMGLTSYIFVKRGLRHSHLKVEEIDAETGRGETDYIHYHKHDFTIDVTEGDGLSDFQRGHRHVIRRDKNDEFIVDEVQGALRARVPSYGVVTFTDRSGNEKEAGIDVGAEQIQRGYSNKGIARVMGISRGPSKIEHGYIEGSTLATATFEFQNVTQARYADGIPIDLSVRAYRSYKGDIESGIRGTLTVRNPETKAEYDPIDFVVEEYQVDEKDIPLSSPGTNANGEATDLDLFKDLVSSDGHLQIVVKCLDRQQYLGVTKSSVYLRPAESTFAWNLAKAYISIWLQMTMVIAFGVMFSTFLSGPVAMVATAVCVLLGFSAEQIYDTRHYIDDTTVENGGGPIEALVRILQQDAMTTQLDVEAFAGKVIKTLDAGIVYVLDATATALPNLPKMVGTAEYAASGFDIFGALLGRHTVATAGYVLLAFLISYFFLKSREIAA